MTSLPVYYLPNQAHAFLVLDAEGTVWLVPPAGWEHRCEYRGRVLPSAQHRLIESAERVVAHLLHLPDAPTPAALDWSVAELWTVEQATAARQPQPARQTRRVELDPALVAEYSREIAERQAALAAARGEV